MNIKNGDIVTLDNGDEVKITLEVINKKITELVQGKKYKLKHTSSICHMFNTDGWVDYTSKIILNETFIYVGKINTTAGERYIFYGIHNTYAMFSTDNLDFVVKEII